MVYRVIFSPEAEEQLAALYRYIAAAATPTTAERYVNALIDYCQSLEMSPLRGTPRDDIRLGLRVTNYKGRTVIAFSVEPSQISVLGLFYGGQDYESVLRDDEQAGSG